MRRVTLDLDFVAHRRPAMHQAGLLGAGLAMLLATGAWWMHAAALRDHQEQAVQDAQRRLAAQRAPATRAASFDPKDAGRERVSLRAQRDLQLPWSELLGALEEASAEGIGLLAIEPVASNQTVRLTVEARDARVMLDYLGRLQSDQRLSQVALMSHVVQAQAPGTPIRFQIQAAWGARS